MRMIHRALAHCLSMISVQTRSVCRDGKPLHAFPDHALASSLRMAAPPGGLTAEHLALQTYPRAMRARLFPLSDRCPPDDA
jgi:hypothetical protein